MGGDYQGIDAVTLDFYNTLAYHREGHGRGAVLMEYLGAQGLGGDDWEHQVLYDVFEDHHTEYTPQLSKQEKLIYFERLTSRLFERLNIVAVAGVAAVHAEAIWRILGPSSFAVFPEVGGVLEVLRGAGHRMAIVSNWQCGLENFCTELGIADPFDHVVSSAEVGYEKPHPAIFDDACRRLGVRPACVLHVGDTADADVDGARAAGLHALLLRRGDEPAPDGMPSISTLAQLPAMLGVAPDGGST